MKSILLSVIILISANTSLARSFRVECENSKGQSLEIEAKIKNLSSMEITEFKIDHRDENFRDQSFAPAFNNGDIDLAFVFGRGWDGDAKISLSRCEDSFDNSGSASIRLNPISYVGSEYELECSCDLDSIGGF